MKVDPPIGNYENDFEYCFVKSDNDDILAITRPPTARAIANQIVTACNNHDGLMEALNEALEELEGEYPFHHPLLVKIRAALEHARGEA